MAAPASCILRRAAARRPWILDVDTTRSSRSMAIRKGRSWATTPRSPGIPSHCYHTYSMASTRLVLDVDVCPGDEHASKHSAPSLWALLDRLPRDLWPALLFGDSGFGNEGIMREAEARGLPYLFKLRLTANVKRIIGEARRRARMGLRRPRLRGQGERRSLDGLEPGAAGDRAASASQRRFGACAKRRRRDAAAFLHRDRRGDRSLRIFGSGHLAQGRN